jgi:hypothetical protein
MSKTDSRKERVEMAKMSEGFKNRVRDAKSEDDRIINLTEDGEPWQVWLARLQVQAERDEALSPLRRQRWVHRSPPSRSS